MKGFVDIMCCQFSNNKQGGGEWRWHSHFHENNKGAVMRSFHCISLVRMMLRKLRISGARFAVSGSGAIAMGTTVPYAPCMLVNSLKDGLLNINLINNNYIDVK